MRDIAMVLAAVLLPACGGELLFLEGAINQLCQRLPAQSFRAPTTPGRPPPGHATPSSVVIERRFDFDVTAQLPRELSSAQLTIGLDHLALTAREPMDWRAVEGARVTLEPPAETELPARVVLEAAQTSPTGIRFDGADLELSPYLNSGVLSYTVALTASTAQMPEPMSELSADVDACANVSVRWDYAR